jgi:hypothetical protein
VHHRINTDKGGRRAVGTDDPKVQATSKEKLQAGKLRSREEHLSLSSLSLSITRTHSLDSNMQYTVDREFFASKIFRLLKFRVV